ncbi:glycosyltransferase [Candidatus Roizmanbacteria bacterium]|nr:glycosyltransferase [Candidatus Roizmanbacteria bacterium]
MKIALVHDQLQEFGGAERVLVSLKKIFPQADVFTSFYNPQTLGVHQTHFKNVKINSSWADKLPFVKKFYSPLRFITPWIWESFDFSSYDVVISSSGSYMSKGIITRPETIHICYLHHQPRYLYYYETAVEWQKYLTFRVYGHLINHELRQWDYVSSQRVDYFIANSEETKKRIQKFYRCDSTVIYPPVNVPKTVTTFRRPSESRTLNPNYYITVSRLARAKHVEVLIKAANKMKLTLKIVGVGRDDKYLKSISGDTVELLGNLTDQSLGYLYKNAEASLYSGVDEEFGIAAVEAMGYGLPIIAFASGGLKETVKDGINGYLFDKLDPLDLSKKIKQLESLSKEKYIEMRKNARKESEKYGFDIFKKKILEFVDNHARTPRG